MQYIMCSGILKVNYNCTKEFCTIGGFLNQWCIINVEMQIQSAKFEYQLTVLGNFVKC